jgi:uncharacterized glyoxalase superfamily protein PhnB
LIKFQIPVMHVSNSAAAEECYCGRLGFRREFALRGDEAKPDPCYRGVRRDGVWIMDKVHAELVRKGARIDKEPVDQTWGSRETYVRDTHENSVRSIQQ